MKVLNFSFQDLKDARDIITFEFDVIQEGNDTGETGNFVVSRKFIQWAKKVIKYYNRIFFILRKWRTVENQAIQLHWKAFYQNLREGIHVFKMYKTCIDENFTVSMPSAKKYAKNRTYHDAENPKFNADLIPCNPKVSKFNLKAKCLKIADSMQTMSGKSSRGIFFKNIK